MGRGMFFDKELIKGCVTVILFIVALTVGSIAGILLLRFITENVAPAIIIGIAVLIIIIGCQKWLD